MNRQSDPAPGARTPDALARLAADWVARRDAGLSPAEERAYAEWLAADPRHRAAIARLEFAWDSLDQPRRNGQADAALGELARRARRRRTATLAVTTCALLLGLGAGWRLLGPRTLPQVESAATASVRLPALQSLADGSIAELRDGGEITVSFTAAQRRVELRRGTAYFKVAKDPARPFVVAAGGVEFRAVGTAFSVQSDPRSLELLVTEGTVAVEVGPAAPAADPLLVSAGSGVSLQLPADGGKPEVTALPAPEIETKLAWRNPRLEFSGTPLAEAIALMNRHNRAQFVIEDPALAATRVSGIFGATNTAAFLSLLESSFDVRAERRGDEIVLHRPR